MHLSLGRLLVLSLSSLGFIQFVESRGLLYLLPDRGFFHHYIFQYSVSFTLSSPSWTPGVNVVSFLVVAQVPRALFNLVF